MEVTKEASTRWDVALLSTLAIRRLGDAEKKPLIFPRAASAKLLAILALEPQRKWDKDELIERIWEAEPLPPGASDRERDAAEKAGQTNFRKILSDLNKTLRGVDPALENLIVRDDARRIGLADDVTSDVAQFRAAVRIREDAPAAAKIKALTRAAELYGGDFLPTFHDSWTETTRRGLRETFGAALSRLALLLEEQGEADAARKCARRLEAALARHDWPDDPPRWYHDALTLLHPKIATPAPLVSTGPRPDSALDPLDGWLLGVPPIVGRAGLLEAIRVWRDGRDGDESESYRLLTLTGTGGVGKTRLAQEAARQARKGGKRVFVAELASCPEPERFVEALAQSLRITASGAEQRRREIAERLCAAPALLVLDNLEHLLPVTANGFSPLADELRTLCEYAPNLRLLTTSRRRVGTPFERELPVPPLAVPTESDAETDADVLLHSAPAVLFAERARQVNPSFVLSVRNAASVAKLCRLADGLPLALRLIAARCRVATPGKLVNEANAIFRILHDPTHTHDRRHDSLERTFSWTYDRLFPEQQRLFAALSVFAGRFTPELAQKIAVPDESRVTLDAALEELCLLSLVERESDPTDIGVTFRLLVPVREFAASRLPPERAERLHQRHADVYLNETERTAAQTFGPEVVSALDWMVAFYPDADAALRHLAATNQWEPAWRFFTALYPLWFRRRAFTRAGISLFDEWFRDAPRVRGAALSLRNASMFLTETPDRARAIAEEAYRLAATPEERAATANGMGYHSVRYDEALQYLDEAVSYGDPYFTALSRHTRASALVKLGRFDEAINSYEAAIVYWRQVGDISGLQASLGALASTLNMRARGGGPTAQSDLFRARNAAREGYDITRTLDDDISASRHAMVLAAVLHTEDDADAGDHWAQISIRHARVSGGHALAEGMPLRMRARCALRRGDLQTAAAQMRRSLELLEKVGVPTQLAGAFLTVADIAVVACQWESAALFRGAADAAFADLNIPQEADESPNEPYRRQLESHLSPECLAVAHAAGRALSPAARLQSALGFLDSVGIRD